MNIGKKKKQKNERRLLASKSDSIKKKKKSEKEKKIGVRRVLFAFVAKKKKKVGIVAVTKAEKIKRETQTEQARLLFFDVKNGSKTAFNAVRLAVLSAAAALYSG